MQITKVSDVRPTATSAVTLKKAGNIYEIRYARSKAGSPIQKLDKDHGIDLRTGEVIDFQHITSRAGDKASVAHSLKRLRDLINANLTIPKMALWVTLTYAENMKDPKQLYQDFHSFWKRFSRYLDKHGHSPAEYITAAEPQARGAWHLHGLFLFPEKAPFIPNQEIARTWGHGFTKVKSLEGIGNPGLYLTAYLSDMELSEALSAGATRGRITEADTTDEQGKRQNKAIVKGARLRLYPPGFNLYRTSRGVKRPEVWQTTESEAQEAINGAPLTYEKTIAITDEAGEVKNIINYRQYNIASKEGGPIDREPAAKFK